MKTKSTHHPNGVLVDGFAVEDHPSYACWAGMKQRCDNPSAPPYKNYGGRGITYCEDWTHFANFARDMGIRPSPKHSIDRINNDAGYSPENCRWATRSEQCLNRRKFSNNTSGFTGVEARRGRFIARYMGEMLAGSFATPEEAFEARVKFIAMKEHGMDVTHLLERKARYDSRTGIKGITKYSEGDYIVRVTNAEGKRLNLGHFTRLESAVERLEAFKKLNAEGRDYSHLLGKAVRDSSTTGVQGISLCRGHYLVRTPSAGGKRIFLGSFKTLDEAKERLGQWQQEQK